MAIALALACPNAETPFFSTEHKKGLFISRLLFVIHKVMAQRKKMGRPPTGLKMGEPVTVRLPPKILAKVKGWAKGRSVPRSEAIRQLIELGLVAEGKSTRR